MKATHGGWIQSTGRRMARGDGSAKAERGEADGRLRSHPAVIALVRLLARQAARDALMASRVEQESQNYEEED